jgi:hypothetical protein
MERLGCLIDAWEREQSAGEGNTQAVFARVAQDLIRLVRLAAEHARDLKVPVGAPPPQVEDLAVVLQAPGAFEKELRAQAFDAGRAVDPAMRLPRLDA